MGSPALGPTDEITLQCVIEVAPEQQPGKPVVVKGTFHNSGPDTITICPADTFLDPAWGDCFSISRNGVPVEYQGQATAQRGQPTREVMIEIDPGQSRSSEINISGSYNVWLAGDYELFFHMRIVADRQNLHEFLRPDENRAITCHVESAKVRFRTRDAEPPIFQGLDEGQEADFRSAHRWAFESMIVALVDAQHLGRQYKKYFDEKLSDGWQQRQATVVRNLEAMIGWVATTPLLIRKAPDAGACNDDNYLGMSVPFQKDAILLCPRAFSNSVLQHNYGSPERGRAFVLVHEISHAVAGTTDVDYNNVERFAVTEPATALVNAQNYAEIALNGYSTPTAVRINNGIWADRRVSGGGGRASHGCAAIEVYGDVLVAYREPEATKMHPDARSTGGQLCYKMLELTDGGQNWKNATPFRPAFEVRGARELRSLVSPALARWEGYIYCAYIDAESGLSTVKAREPGGAPGARGWQDLNWVGTDSETKPEGISSDDDASKTVRVSPALAGYAGVKRGLGYGKSTGLYCAYVDSGGMLKCAAKLRTAAGLSEPWTPVNFDKARKSISAPALISFSGQLRCAYRDAGKSRYVILRYQETDADHLGIWVEENSFPNLNTSTIALSEWRAAGGASLVAAGSVVPTRISDRRVRYSILFSDGKWSKEVATDEYTSDGALALVPTERTGGRLLLAFLAGREGNIEWIRAQS